jgi:hypothetical protein
MGGEALAKRKMHVLEVAAGAMQQHDCRSIRCAGVLAYFDDVLAQAVDLDKAPTWRVRPLDQPDANEGDGGAGAKEDSDNGERVHSSRPRPGRDRDQSNGFPFSQRAPRA